MCVDPYYFYNDINYEGNGLWVNYRRETAETINAQLVYYNNRINRDNYNNHNYHNNDYLDDDDENDPRIEDLLQNPAFTEYLRALGYPI